MISERKYTGHLTMFVVNLIFGINTPITKTLMPDYFSAFSLNFFRVAGAGILFWCISSFVKEEKVTRSDLLLLFFAGMLGVVVNQFAFVKGLSLTTPINAAIIVTLTPIITMLLASLIQKEPITGLKIVGVVVGAIGALLIITTTNRATGGSSSMVGNILCLLSSLSYALYLTVFKKLINKHKPVTLMKWMFLFSTIIALPMCIGDLESIRWSAITASAYIRIGYVVILATFVTYMMIPVGQKMLRPTTLSMYNYLQPIVASLVAVYFGMDTFGWKNTFAAVLVFLGVYTVTQSKSKER
ncbi:MAG: DMT family transporter [Paludibacteraceae bacterium]